MARKKKKKTKLTAHYKKIMALLSLICAVYFSVYYPELLPEANVSNSVSEETDFSGEASVEVNGNKPTFTEDEIVDQSFEKYGEQDSLGRCTTAVACVGQDIMPTEKRESIARIKPTGWKQNKYPGVVRSKPPYLYNRCHLIGFQLTGENDNDKNFVTGTRYLNVDGMLPYENMVASYVKESGNHVMYRVTPVFEGDNLLCSGVNIEALSVEDGGAGICFNVFCYNVQPGVVLNYADGSNWLEEQT
ncbi:DNA-entry nuclease [Butyrivibrio hungatei]|uniref:DNA-entry nuclease n=1 Tax=Butyrivibrio hungatei TaxID=185008 RepID=A0A1G5CJH0_9FIRM|nr:DNA/RNA non-specific endonuclease [Butyrivibrio hungatei]SCY02468.1 DNA-entry nuclease [Butyrivibrio hungatei]